MNDEVKIQTSWLPCGIARGKCKQFFFEPAKRTKNVAGKKFDFFAFEIQTLWKRDLGHVFVKFTFAFLVTTSWKQPK